MSLQQFESPQAAALAGFPPGTVRIVAVRADGDEGYVLLDTRPNGPPYHYGVVCTRGADGWAEGSSSNGGGWSAINNESDLGTLVLWDVAPPGADRVRVAYRLEIHEEDIEQGMFLSSWWRVPCPEEEWPRLVAFRVASHWVNAT